MFEKKVKEEAVKVKKEKVIKERSGKSGKEKALSILKTLVLPALLAGIIVCVIYVAMQTKAAGEELKTTILCMREDVAKNTYVKPDEVDKYFTTVKVETVAVPKTAIKSAGELPKEGFYIEDAMSKSQMVLKDNIADKDSVMDKYLDGYEVTSFDAADFADGVNGALRRGDIIDVFALDPATESLVLLATDVYISDVYDNSGNKITTPEEIATAFTVYVTPQEVEAINTAICYGGIQLYLKCE